MIGVGACSAIGPAVTPELEVRIPRRFYDWCRDTDGKWVPPTTRENKRSVWIDLAHPDTESFLDEAEVVLYSRPAMAGVRASARRTLDLAYTAAGLGGFE